MKTILGGVLAASLFASPTFAQSSGAWNGLDDRFQIDTGFFGIDADSVLRFEGGDVEPREGPRREQARQHVLAGRDLARRAAAPAEAGLHQVQPRPGRLHPPARLHLGRRDLQRRALGEDDVRHRHPGGLLPFRGLPQRALRDRPDRRLRLPLDQRGHPGHGENRRRRAARWTRARAPAASRVPSAATRTAGSRSASSRGRTTSTSRCRRETRTQRSPTGGSGRTITSSATPAWAPSTSTTGTATTAGLSPPSWAAS